MSSFQSSYTYKATSTNCAVQVMNAMSAPLVVFKFPVVLLTPILAALSGASSICMTSMVAADALLDDSSVLCTRWGSAFSEDLRDGMSLSGISVGVLVSTIMVPTFHSSGR